MNNNTRGVFPLAAIAAALFSIYGSAWAEDNEEIKSFTKPASTIRLGAGYLTADGALFGQYTGVRKDEAYGLVDLDMVTRNDETGTWFKAEGRNLGLDNRDLRITHERQGNWGYYFDYSQTPRYLPLTVNTSLSGLGTTRQTRKLSSAPRHEEQLKTQREGYGLGFSKQLGGGFDVQLSARNEEKDGSRIWSTYVSNAIWFLTEPINSSTRQYEGTLNYRGEKLQLSGGYYGSSYDNQNAKVDALIPGSAVVTDFALPPSNDSHQLYLSGGYAFTPTTRSTFKVSTTRSTQNQPFYKAPTFPAAAGYTSLNGLVETTLLQMGLTARPIPKLSLLANLRYEDRDDKTPRRKYIAQDPVTPVPPQVVTRDGYNVPMSRELLTGKAEASYQLPMSMRLTGGVDVENTTRSITPTARQASWRYKNDETSYRLELRRSLSDTLNGAVSYVQSKRDGSPFLEANNNITAGVPTPDVIDPIHWANRDRKKVRLSMDWTPVESLSLQFMIDAANDRYDSPNRLLGPDTGKGRLYSVDAAYTLSDAWQATAWVSRDENHMSQTTVTSANASLGVVMSQWHAQLSNVGNAVGFGVRGKPSFKWQVGADLQFMEDTNKYGLSQLSPKVGSLPDIHNRTVSLKLFGTYALKKNSSLRLDYVYDRRTTDDWTWTALGTDWAYADGTTVSQNPNQNVQFIGVSYIHKF